MRSAAQGEHLRRIQRGPRVAPRRESRHGCAAATANRTSHFQLRSHIGGSERVIIRAVSLEEMTETRAESCRDRLIRATARWHVLRLSAEVVARARRLFRLNLFE